MNLRVRPRVKGFSLTVPSQKLKVRGREYYKETRAKTFFAFPWSLLSLLRLAMRLFLMFRIIRNSVNLVPI